MGQAKQRRDSVAQGAPVRFRNRVTGELEWGRRAPSVRELWGLMERRVAAEERGERPQVAVPCQGCTACCHMEKIDFVPADERPQDLAHLDYELDPERAAGALMRRKDGACVHLGPQGCTVYQHRPRVCRTFDCRVAAVAGVGETYADGSHWPVWVPEQAGIEDRMYHAALCAAATIEISRAQRAGEAWDAQEVAEKAWKQLPELVPLFREGYRYLATLPLETVRDAADAADANLRAMLQHLGRNHTEG